MSEKNRSGFSRLKGMAAVATVGLGAAMMPGTARAIVPSPTINSRETRFNVFQTFGGSATSTQSAMNWLGIGNGSTLAAATYTTTTTQYLTTQIVTIDTSVVASPITTISFTFYPTSATTFTSSPNFGWSYTSCDQTGPSTWYCTGSISTSYPITIGTTFRTVTFPVTETIITDTIINTGVVRTRSEPVDTAFQIQDGNYYEPGEPQPRIALKEGGLFDGVLGFDVNGEDFINPGGQVQYVDGTLTTNRMLNIVPGIHASLKYFFSDELPFVRAMYILENDTGSDIAVDLAVNGDLAYNGNTTVQASGSGDAVASDNDSWVAVNDSGSVGTDGAGDVILVTRYGGLAKVKPVDAASLGSGDADVFSHVYDVTVPANGTARVVVYLAVAADLEAGQAMANELSRNPRELLADLTQDEINEVVNYGPVPVTASSGDDLGDLIGSTGWVTLLGGFGLMLRRRRRQ